MPRLRLTVPLRASLALAGALILGAALLTLGGAAARAQAAPASAAVPSHPFATGLVDPSVFTGPDAPLAFARAKSSGAQVVRLSLIWNTIVYGGAQKPAFADAADPADPAYDWQAFDRQITQARAAGLEPLVTVIGPPLWALDGQGGGQGAGQPHLDDLKAFVLAAVRHYDGAHGEPRVRYWQIWNEPNARRELSPQRASGLTGALLAPAIYRSMINAVAPAVHSVPGDLVVLAGVAPFAHSSHDIQVTAPFTFLRSFLCVAPDGRSSCQAKVSFDVLSVNPYTAGGPAHKGLPGDLSLGDLPAAEALLARAYALGHVVSPKRPALWVSEFAWDTQDTHPKDPGAVPVAVESRWVAEALYRMWSSGVSLVTWIILRDEPTHGSGSGPYQCGLYSYHGPALSQDRPKPLLAAFRFPFYAAARAGRLYVWGRTPDAKAHTVVIEVKQGTAWRRLATVRATATGVFQKTLGTSPNGVFRARVAAQASPGFRPDPTPDLRVQPFGDI